MKNFLLTTAFATCVGFSSAFAQCTPNPTACTPENEALPACIHPDVADSGFVGTSYSGQAINILIGQKVKSPGLPLDIFIRRVEIVKVQNIPAGLSLKIYTANPSDGANGVITINPDGTPSPNGTMRPPNNNDKGTYVCGVLTGTPTTATAVLDSMQIIANIYVNLGSNTGDGSDPNSLPGGEGTNPITFNYKVPVGADATSIDKMDILSMLNLELFPNPGVGAAKLNYNIFETTDVAVRVTALDGKEVYQSNLGTQTPGKHSFEVPALPQGFYLVSLKVGQTEVTKKLIRN